MTIQTNDKGEDVMTPDTGLDRVRMLWPATIQKVKELLKSAGTLKAIDTVKGFKMSAEDKKAVLFISSGFRLIRKFD